MDESHLYKRIAETFRQEILSGRLNPGDRLPSVRQVSERWSCTIGTVQRAYQELVRQGLVTSRAGQGTRVIDRPAVREETPLRRLTLVHRAEAFLLEVLNSGFTIDEVERAVRQAMDRWRAAEREEAPKEDQVIRFVGSHDLAVTWIASQFGDITGGYILSLNFTGSLGGLIALAEGTTDLAGSHLWDDESRSFNAPFVRRLLPGRKTALVTLAHRRLGLILPPGNPKQVQALEHLARPGIRFMNRQSGSGTRVWLDQALEKAGIPPGEINGYHDEKLTHSAVAQVVAEGQADAGIGLEASALSYGLDFVFLTDERYDLVIMEDTFAVACIQNLLDWLSTAPARRSIENLGGYDARETGHVEWV
jgi:putative molybdopterin biosynthesis protein